MTGKNVFEQRDVEIPADWSLNSLNIVAQKYFTGTPGTPDREASIKHLIDRVVDTVTRQGVQEGYFTEGTEAEDFREELKYVLATQRAAFNSPVWFNIGAPGRAQQASACFILGVQDTMESILNWYTEEGMIFKGGSGAGVNLSAIRSSIEPLSKSGGTASGPLSFMRGADSSVPVPSRVVVRPAVLPRWSSSMLITRISKNLSGPRNVKRKRLASCKPLALT
jgi:ribonucleoside-diphosphate reductase alpha chain